MATGLKSISVIIPTYRRQDYLDRAVASVVAQSDLLPRTEVEIVVVDDASPEPIEAPSGIDNLQVVRLTKNAGAGGARNAGIAASRGDYIAFLDSDDVWLPEKLARQIDLASRVGARPHSDKSKLVVSCGFYIPNRLGGLLETRIPKEAASLSDFVGGCWMCPGSTFFAHRSVFDRAGGFDPRLRRLEDFDWMLRFASQGGQLRVARHAGVLIAPSVGSKLEPVELAVKVLRKKLEGELDLGLTPSDHRILQSYLQLELAAARLSGGWRVRGGYHLARSLMLKPRLTGSTEAFWEIEKAVPADVVARYQEMSAAASR